MSKKQHTGKNAQIPPSGGVGASPSGGVGASSEGGGASSGKSSGLRYFLIAGEASGDLHASNLMCELKKMDPDAEFCFLGGDLMTAQG